MEICGLVLHRHVPSALYRHDGSAEGTVGNDPAIGIDCRASWAVKESEVVCYLVFVLPIREFVTISSFVSQQWPTKRTGRIINMYIRSYVDIIVRSNLATKRCQVPNFSVPVLPISNPNASR